MTADPGGPPGNLPPTGVGPTCYRHPNRPTALSCVRCERPICPDCMVEAPVGFQCRDCVRAGSKTVRVGRTPFGGRVTSNSHAVTYALIGLNALAFVFELSSTAFVSRFWQFSAIYAPGTRHPVGGVAHGEYYRLVTSMFLHLPPSTGNTFFLHILFNMWALSVVGPPLEALLGRVRFTALYLLTGLAGSVLTYVLATPYVPELGASGAIFGLFGALFVVGRRLRLNIQPIAATIGLNLVLTFSLANIGWQAHIGGLVAGAALAAAWAYAPRNKRTAIQLASSVALLALLVVVVVARTHQLRG
jgi:membrane associated rhomboid family serine protease